MTQVHRLSLVSPTSAATAVLGLLASLLVVTSSPAAAVMTTVAGNTVTHVYGYTNALETLTVPSNVSEITITIKGGEGGWGGYDSVGRPPQGGYRGLVSGTIQVTPGDILTIAVGQGGADSSVAPNCSAGYSALPGSTPQTRDSREAVGGLNPLGGYRGGNGGSTGKDGCSGYGGAGGAASVLLIGNETVRDSVATIVAGGAGGTGGSGQFIKGRIPLATHAPRTDAVTTNGEYGKYTSESCFYEGLYENRCDGGGGAGGGGGAVGGARGLLEFGQGSNTEWFGHGAWPGSNATSGLAGLSASYEYYSGNNGNGSITITYSSGVPGQPTGVTATAGNTSADVYWSAPTLVGDGPVTGYTVEYATDPYSSWSTAAGCTGLATECTVTGLTNGTPYKFRVTAANATGSGNPSAVSAAVTPSGPPETPTVTAITPTDGALSVAFTAPASSLDIINYEYSLNNGQTWISGGTASSPLTITGLRNGTVYAVSIRAVSSAGVGGASPATNATPSALPGAPTITNVQAGQAAGTLLVTFLPGYNGGSTITDYEYATSPGENTSDFSAFFSAGSPSETFTITGLQTGAVYTVALRAKNTAGVGPASPYRTGVTLAEPQAPTITAITPADSRLTIAYTVYDSVTSGGSAITRIDYSLDNGGNWVDAGTLANPFTIAGLANGTSYSIRLRATNAIGTSGQSSVVSGTPAGAPSSPRQVGATAGQASASVSWTAPLATNGAAVETYTATAFTSVSGSTAAATCTTAQTSCTITGLDNGTTYHVAVTATNAVGTSAASSPRISVTPAALPGAPTINSITGGNAFLSVAFSAGTADANAPVTGYQYSVNGGQTWTALTGTSSPLFISGLSNGTTYSVLLRATSSVGSGAASNAVSGTPFTVPEAVDPNTISYTAGAGQVTVSWAAANNNGSAISAYTVSAFNAALAGSIIRSCSTASTSCTISNLSNGVTYYVSVQSENAAGFSTRSAPRVAVRPGAISTTTMTATLESVTVGTAITFTATVPETATGTVNFTSGGTSITNCSAVTVETGTAACTTSALAVGTNSVRANYSGDGFYSSSASSVIAVTVAALTQNITFAALTNKILDSESFTVSATGGASTNPVTFTSLTTNVCTTTGTNGTTITLRALGACTIRASQAGNANYAAATPVERTFQVVQLYTVTFDAHGGTGDTTTVTFAPGNTPITLPIVTRAGYTLEGWFTAVTGGTNAGRGGQSYEPTATGALHARWVQTSLWGMGPAVKIGTMTTQAGIGSLYRASSGSNVIDIEYTANSLPANTVIDIYLLNDGTRAASLIAEPVSFLTNIVVAWKASDDTVPSTAVDSPLRVTIQNAAIKAGMKVYSVLGETVTELGTATQDGVVTVYLTDDPEIAIAATTAAAPTQVVASVSGQTVSISWTAPTQTGGEAVTGYRVYTGSTQVCTTSATSCVATGLQPSTSYTFTVRAVNAVGEGAASSASNAITTPSTPGGSVVTPPPAEPEPTSSTEPTPVVPPLMTPVVYFAGAPFAGSTLICAASGLPAGVRTATFTVSLNGVLVSTVVLTVGPWQVTIAVPQGAAGQSLSCDLTVVAGSASVSSGFTTPVFPALSPVAPGGTTGQRQQPLPKTPTVTVPPTSVSTPAQARTLAQDLVAAKVAKVRIVSRYKSGSRISLQVARTRVQQMVRSLRAGGFTGEIERSVTSTRRVAKATIRVVPVTR